MPTSAKANSQLNVLVPNFNGTTTKPSESGALLGSLCIQLYRMLQSRGDLQTTGPHMQIRAEHTDDLEDIFCPFESNIS